MLSFTLHFAYLIVFFILFFLLICFQFDVTVNISI